MTSSISGAQLGDSGSSSRLLHEALLRLDHRIAPAEVDSGAFGPSTRAAVLAFQRDQSVAASGAVDDTTAVLLEGALAVRGKAILSGRLQTACGGPIRRTRVTAFDIAPADEAAIGTALSDDDGWFVIEYDLAALGARGKTRADVVLRAPDVAAASELQLAAPPAHAATVLGTVAPEPVRSEYALVNAAAEQLFGSSSPPTSVVGSALPAGRRARPVVPMVVPMVVPAVVPAAVPALTDAQLTVIAARTGLERDCWKALIAADAGARELAIDRRLGYALCRGYPGRALDQIVFEDRGALERKVVSAIDDGIVEPATKDGAAQLFDQRLAGLRADLALRPGAAGGAATLGDVLRQAEFEPSEQTAIALVLHDNKREQGSLAERLVGENGFSQDRARRAQVTIDLASLCGNHPPIVEALRPRMKQGDLRELAPLDGAAWAQLIATHGTPPGTPGTDDERARYAGSLQGRVEATYKTAVIAARIEQRRFQLATDQDHTDVAAFFRDNPGYQVDAQPLELVLEQPDVRLDGVIDTTALRRNLLRVERLTRFAPSVEIAGQLFNLGYGSAAEILRGGKGAFLARAGGAALAQNAAETYAAAARQSAVALSLFAMAHPSLAPEMQVLKTASDDAAVHPLAGTPTFRALFGNLDFCACQACGSVLGPAAYLVDLLGFLEITTLDDTTSLADVLLARRPDIANLLLTCENTNTRLPYIDVVNEILERRLEGPSFVVNPMGVPPDATVLVVRENLAWQVVFPDGVHDVVRISPQALRFDRVPFPQVTRSEAELRLHPQHVRPVAYAPLAGRTFPAALPLDLATEEIRAYVALLGVRRADVMAAVHDLPRLEATPFGALAAADQTRLAGLAAEQLGLVPAEARGFFLDPAGWGVPAAPWAWFGLAQTGNVLVDPRNGLPLASTQPANRHPITATGWRDVLSRVSVLIDRLGVSYAELLVLLDLRFVAGTPPVALSITGEDCDTSQMQVAGPDGAQASAAALVAMVRFVRLWRRVGGSMHDVDRALALLPAASDPERLVCLAQLLRLRDRLRLPIAVLLAWWAPIDTRAYTDRTGDQPRALPTPYDQVFQDDSANRPVDPDLALGPDGEPAAGLTDLALHQATLLGALRITSAELSALLDEPGVVAGSRLTRDNLSRLDRHVSLARALRMSVGDLLIARRLVDVDPFATPAQALRFIDEVDRIARSGFSIADLDYLLRHRVRRDTRLAIDDDAVRAILEALRGGLARIASETAVTRDPAGERTRSLLAALEWPRPMIDDVIGFLGRETRFQEPVDAEPPDVAIPVALRGRVDLEAGQLVLIGALTADERDQLLVTGPAPAFSGDRWNAAVYALYDRALAVVRERTAAIAAATGKAGGGPLMTAGVLRSVRMPRLESELRFAATLDRALATPFVDRLPEALRGRFAIEDQILRFVGLMNDAVARTLRAAAAGMPAVMAAVDALRTWVEIPRALADRVTYDGERLVLRLEGWLHDPERETLAALVAPGHAQKAAWDSAVGRLVSLQRSLPEPADADRWLAATDVAPLLYEIGDPAARFQVALERLAPQVRHRLQERLVVQWVASAEAVSQDIAALLLGVGVTGGPLVPAVGGAAGAAAISAFLDPAFADTAPGVPGTREHLPVAFETYLVLHKAAALAARLAVRPAELRWLLGGAAPALGALPVAPAAAVPDACRAWPRLLRRVELRDQLPNGWMLPDALSAGSPPEPATLATAFAVTPALLDEAAAVLGIDLHALDELTLGALRALLELLRRTGARLADAADWASPGPTAAAAASVKQAARARYDDAAWAEAATPAQDALRERQRDALVQALLDRTNGQADPDDLYGELLIDVQMSACALTTRVLQATSAVQLLVQRCLLGIERTAAGAEIPASRIDGARWSWMKSYRVWEANRRVFLYPENWLEPELRTDKSALYQTLESALAQVEVNREAVERAYVAYLTSLADIGRLEVVALYQETAAAEGRDVLHVFARTYAQPHRYYHAQRIDSTFWRPWEAIELDIEGDHLLPAVFHQRLHLFWPRFTEAAEVTQVPQQGTSALPDKRLMLELRGSIQTDGTWSASRIIAPPIDTGLPVADPASRALNAPSCALFAALTDPGRVQLLTAGFRNAQRGAVFTLLDPDRISQDIVSGYYLAGQGAPFSQGAVDWQFTNNVIVLAHPRLELPSHAFGGLPVRPILGEVPRDPDPRARLAVAQRRDLAVTSAIRLPWLLASADSGPFTFEGGNRGFLCSPVRFLDIIGWTYLGGVIPWPIIDYRDALRFEPLHHPTTRRLLETLATGGLGALLALDSQRPDPADAGTIDCGPRYGPRSITRGLEFATAYAPNWYEVDRFVLPGNSITFEPDELYAHYNWELFFHAPFAIACKLSQQQRFAEARDWFHFIFNPGSTAPGSIPGRYWNVLPLVEAGQTAPIDALLRILGDSGADMTERRKVLAQIRAWLEEPFKPHAVAKLRPRAYQLAVVRKYIENLIAWADQLFRRDTVEAINEATQLYVLASQILGRRPEQLPPRARRQPQTYASLRITETMHSLEGLLPALPPGGPSLSQADIGALEVAATLQSTYFCVPFNDQLFRLWDTVEDRLFKVRHCMNIDGTVRQLAMFDPPIDPAMLVKAAAAAGIDLSSALADAQTPPPRYRFGHLIQRAGELAAEARAFGGALLAAIEKRDAEILATLRAGHEIQLLAAVRLVKLQLLQEANANLDTVHRTAVAAHIRFRYYCDLLSSVETVDDPDLNAPGTTGIAQLGNASLGLLRAHAEQAAKLAPVDSVIKQWADKLATQTDVVVHEAFDRLQQVLSLGATASDVEDKVTLPMNRFEKRQLEELKAAHEHQNKAMQDEDLAQVLAHIPDFTIGVEGFASSPTVQAQIGGTLFSAIARLEASKHNYQASQETYRANLHAILAGHRRRADEWLHQARQSLAEVDQLACQVRAASIRVALAACELASHDRQAANALEVDAFMREKFSSRDLYDWMVGQLSTVHMAAYQLAYDMARRAEVAYRHELGLDASQFVRFGQWGSLRKGLLAGDKLHHDIKRLEASYLEQNAREYEITKHVSLLQLDGEALLRLRATGACELELPEVIFDLDFPGHYFRRIKSVSVSLPCVIGPYGSVTGKLTLLRSAVRRTIPRDSYGDPAGLETSTLPTQSIATSSAQNDSGLFELSFRDERYLPFEGAGACSRWRFELPRDFRQFDYESISDLILHVRYTARDGGEPLARLATGAIRDQLNALRGLPDARRGQWRIHSLRHESPNEWQALVSSPTGTAQLAVPRSRFPYLASTQRLSVLGVACFALVRAANGATGGPPALPFTLTIGRANNRVELALRGAARVGAWRYAGGSLPDAEAVASERSEATWDLAVDDPAVLPLLDDLVVLWGYQIEAP